MLIDVAQPSLVYRARPSLPRVILLHVALALINYKRVRRGGREGLAEVISIHSLFSTIALSNIVYLLANAFFIFVDLTGRPSFMQITSDLRIRRHYTRR